MKAYTAQIIYKIKCDGISTEQYEEQWRLVFASDMRDALFQARVVAKEEETTFVDRHGRTVAWELVAVKDMQEVDVKHGSLLFSSVKEIEPIASPLWTEPETVMNKKADTWH
ncbi:hypothetical protein CAP35_10870 [Chitinophagaceae bacterium IBVUCB1]|nr:hypothetical protein CAP35_10870 [Chitinophagaceae bacterium IBVUCB1]